MALCRGSCLARVGSEVAEISCVGVVEVVVAEHSSDRPWLEMGKVVVVTAVHTGISVAV